MEFPVECGAIEPTKNYFVGRIRNCSANSYNFVVAWVILSQKN